MKKYILVILVLGFAVIFFPFLGGKKITAKVEYMFYACDTPCPAFKVLAVREQGLHFLVNKEVIILYNNGFLQESASFFADKNNRISYVQGYTGRRNLVDVLSDNSFVIVAKELK